MNCCVLFAFAYLKIIMINADLGYLHFLKAIGVCTFKIDFDDFPNSNELKVMSPKKKDDIMSNKAYYGDKQ